MARRPPRPQQSSASGRNRFDAPHSGSPNAFPPPQRFSRGGSNQRKSAPRGNDNRGAGNMTRDYDSRSGASRSAPQGNTSRNPPTHRSAPRSAPRQQRNEHLPEQHTAKRLAPAPGQKSVQPSSANLFVPQMPSSFAVVENERLYLQPLSGVYPLAAGTSAFATPLSEALAEQALMRHLTETGFIVPSESVRSFVSEMLQAQDQSPEKGEFATKPLPTQSRETDDTPPAPKAKPVKRPQPIDEPEEARSPFAGDIIETMQEVLIARNSGRYVPLPKSSEKPRPPGVDLHPAIGFKLYAPNPHKSPTATPNQKMNLKYQSRHYSRPERVYPAAVPLDAVFDTMPTATNGFHERLQRVLRYEAELPPGAELVVAVSGGVDSIVLLDMLMCLARKNSTGQHSISLAVVHFNHRLRGVESEHDANFVRETCKRYDVPCYIAWADVERFAEIQSMSLEQAGRELRYKFLEFVAYKRRADAVLTAHTLNDSVETLLMNMIRGSGLAGLSGIPVQRAFGDHTKLLRPLLGMKKAEIQEYASLRGLSWREDASNAQSVFRRNKIRNELLPLLEREYSSGIVDVLHRTSQIILGADDLVRETVERILPLLVVEEEFQPYIGLNITPLRIQKRFLQSELVRRTVQRRFGIALGFEAVDRVLSLIDAEIGTKVDVMRGFIALRDRTMIVLAPAPAVHNLNVRVEKNNQYDFGGWRIFLEEVDRKNVKFTADPAVEFLDTRLLPYRMTLRTWQAGDVFTPLGMKGTMKVSDYLTNSKIPFFNRQNILVLAAAMPEGEQIVWLCGLRLSDRFRLPPDAPKALRLEFRRPKGVVLPVPPQEKG